MQKKVCIEVKEGQFYGSTQSGCRCERATLIN